MKAMVVYCDLEVRYRVEKVNTSHINDLCKISRVFKYENGKLKAKIFN